MYTVAPLNPFHWKRESRSSAARASLRLCFKNGLYLSARFISVLQESTITICCAGSPITVCGADPITARGAGNPIAVCGASDPITVCDTGDSTPSRFKYAAEARASVS
jgi:hypothetical protein